MTGAYLFADQLAIFGTPEVVGFGDTNFLVREVPRDHANEIVRRNHYSGKVYAASHLHFGVFIDGQISGVLQFGPAMNPASGGSVVSGTKQNEYLELNRMWLSDAAPRNSESRALSHSIKIIRRKCPTVKWIQSFADERCGKFGVVYQAANFKYYGEHTSVFWTLDGTVYHNSAMTRNPNQTPSAAHLQANKDRAISMELRQFRYIFFMRPRFERGVRHKQKQFPKHAARLLDAPLPSGVSHAQTVGAAP